MMFLFIILGATDARAPAGFAPIAIGLGLTLIHLIGIPVTNLSVNPARSTGPALVVGGCGARAAVALLGGADRRRRARSGDLSLAGGDRRGRAGGAAQRRVARPRPAEDGIATDALARVD